VKADLHIHTHYSKGTKIQAEGLNSPGEIVKYAKKIGLDAVAITDHDEFEGAIEAEKIGKKLGVTVIKGQEVTATGDKHILGLGLDKRIKPGSSIEETIDQIRKQGGIAIASHPFDLAKKGIREKSVKCDAAEVFNAINLDRFSNRRARRFALKHSIPMVAGSDAHCKEMLGYGVTEIEAGDSVDSVLEAIRKGHTSLVGRYVPVNVIQEWSQERFNNSFPEVLEYIEENYKNPKKWISMKLLKLTKRSPGRIDYFFKGLAYFSFGTAVCYSAVKNSLGL